MDKPNDAQAEAIQHDEQIVHDQSQEVEPEYLVLIQQYQSLYKDYHALLKRSPISMEHYPNRAASLLTLHDYRESLHEHRQGIQQFRRTLRKLIIARSYPGNQSSPGPADRPLIRKTILLGEGNAQEAAFVKERVQQASTHRVFLAADSHEVLCVLHNVQIDMLVLDEGLTPLPGNELYHHLHCLKQRLPTIIMSASFSFLRQLEQRHSHLIGLEKPVKVETLVKTIDQLLV